MGMRDESGLRAFRKAFLLILSSAANDDLNGARKSSRTFPTHEMEFQWPPRYGDDEHSRKVLL